MRGSSNWPFYNVEKGILCDLDQQLTAFHHTKIVTTGIKNENYWVQVQDSVNWCSCQQPLWSQHELNNNNLCLIMMHEVITTGPSPYLSPKATTFSLTKRILFFCIKIILFAQVSVYTKLLSSCGNRIWWETWNLASKTNQYKQNLATYRDSFTKLRLF